MTDDIIFDKDSPEITSTKGFRPGKDVMPELVEAMKAKRGRPKLDSPKQHIGMRLDADIVEWLRSQKGYNALVNETLRNRMEGRP